MRTRILFTGSFTLAILLALWLAGPTGSIQSALADQADCDVLDPAAIWDGAECDLNVAITRNGVVTLPQTLHIGPNGKITTDAPGGLTLNITGDLIVDTPAGDTGTNGFSGDVSGTGAAALSGRPITVTATGDIMLHGDGSKGAQISSNQTAGSCSGGKGGDITLSAGTGSGGGNITTEAGSVISANARCPAGEIVISGSRIEIGGLVESASQLSGTGASQRPGGGPITIDAGCLLNMTGTVSSRGRDPGGDLVHLEAGCTVAISGLVESTGPGHAVPNNPANHCNDTNRPDKSANSTACVEVWSGGTILVDAVNGAGQINADIGQAGGTRGMSWIDLFASGDITVLGPDSGSFAVHANGALGVNTDTGGVITVKSTSATFEASGLALQADATRPGSDGGRVTVEADQGMTLDGASLYSRGDFVQTGGYGDGGAIAARTFNAGLSWQNGVGHVEPTGTVLTDPVKRGTIALTYCTSINTAGTSFPVTGAGTATTPTETGSTCGSAPTLPDYLRLPACACSPNAISLSGAEPDLAGGNPGLQASLFGALGILTLATLALLRTRR